MRAEILIYDFIGSSWFEDGVTAKGFVEELDGLNLGADDELLLRVNSPGGSVFDGYAIHNAIKFSSAKTIARVEGLAASAASYIIQAADEIEVAEASFVMIHRAWGLTVGNAEDHLATAAELEKYDSVLAKIYADRSKKPEGEWLAAMSAETWYTGPEAIEAGLADRLIEADKGETEVEAAARWDSRVLSFFRHAPAAVLRRGLERQPLTAPLRAASAATTPPPATPPEITRAEFDELRAELNALRANFDVVPVRIETLEALAGLRKE